MKIALIGYGAEGEASYRYFSRSPENEVIIFDESKKRPAHIPKEVLVVTGPRALDELRTQTFDKVVRTPSLSPYKLKDIPHLTSATREFFEQCPAPIIGVTGTKGKGTIASLVYEILKAAGKTVWLVGNIGKPALEILSQVAPDDIVIYELSSFQLWDLNRSPHTAVVSVVEPEHLDVHRDIDDYISAKANIRRFQTIHDHCFYHPTNEMSRAIANSGGPHDPSEHELWLSQAHRYGVPDDGAVYVKNNSFYVLKQEICSVNALQLIGQHNVENACAAISAALKYTDDYAAVEKGLKQFKGLPHRIEFVREVKGVKYYDDSFSSAPPATKVAVASFEQPVILIAGGFDRGLEYDELAKYLASQKHIKKILLIGETKQLIRLSLEKCSLNNFEIVDDNLSTVVRRAQQSAVAGDVVVFSPGCASFDMFKNFVERGERYQKIVREL